MTIDLKGTENPLDPNRKANAFPLPGSNDTLRYLESDPDPKYQGYLVKVTSYDNEKINFQGVNLTNSTPSETTRTLYYKDMRNIWLPGPSSSLSTWSTTNCCIILFLSDDYTTGKTDLLNAQGGGGKYPKGSGLALLDLHMKVQNFEAKSRDWDNQKQEWETQVRDLQAINTSLKMQATSFRDSLESIMHKLPDADKLQLMNKFSDLLK